MRLTVLQRRGPISYHVSSFSCEYFTLGELLVTMLLVSLANILHSVSYAPLFSPHLSTLYGTQTKPQGLVVWARAL